MFYEEELQYHIACKKGDVGRYVILPGDPGRCEKIAQYFDNPKHVACNREFNIYTGTLFGEKVSVCSTGIGGPSAAIAMEELHNIGADTFIRVGTCGVLDPSIKVRDIVIGDAAYSISSFNQSFGKTDERLFFPSRKLTNKIYSLADKKFAKKGTIYTSDVFDMYINISDIIKAIPKDIHVVVSEMEAAGLFLIANKLNKKAACILTVTDSKFEPHNIISSIERQNTLDNMLLLALEASLD